MQSLPASHCGAVMTAVARACAVTATSIFDWLPMVSTSVLGALRVGIATALAATAAVVVVWLPTATASVLGTLRVVTATAPATTASASFVGRPMEITSTFGALRVVIGGDFGGESGHLRGAIASNDCSGRLIVTISTGGGTERGHDCRIGDVGDEDLDDTSLPSAVFDSPCADTALVPPIVVAAAAAAPDGAVSAPGNG